MKVTYPVEQTYVALQLDTIGMVQHLGDPVALAEASAMTPKKYLVYISMAEGLPLPQSPWCQYLVDPISTSLRAEDKEEGYTPDMVIPILPNTHYAKGRAPVRPRPSFPFPNCFHWIECELNVRIAPVDLATAYDYSHATRLSARQQFAIVRKFTPDYRRLAEYHKERENLFNSGNGATDGTAFPSDGQNEGLDLRPDAYVNGSTACGVDGITLAPLNLECDIDDFLEEAPSEASELDHWGDIDRLRRELLDAQLGTHCGSQNRNIVPENRATPRETEAVEDNAPSEDFPRAAAGSFTYSFMDSVLSVDIFGERSRDDPTVQVVPLVRVWLELEEHLKADSIPSPEELFKEVEMMEIIVNAALERQAAKDDFNIQAPSERASSIVGSVFTHDRSSMDSDVGGIASTCLPSSGTPEIGSVVSASSKAEPPSGVLRLSCWNPRAIFKKLRFKTTRFIENIRLPLRLSYLNHWP